MGLQYYVVDVETNGLNDKLHEITQLSIIRCSDRHQFSKYIRIQFPDRTSIDALNHTGRKFADLLQGDKKETVIDQVNNFLAQDQQKAIDRCMIGFNVSFDRRFLTALWKSVEQTFPAELWLDILPMMRQYAKQQGLIKPKLTLQHALYLCQIKPRLPFHSAITDTQNTYILREFLIKQGIDCLPLIKKYAELEE